MMRTLIVVLFFLGSAGLLDSALAASSNDAVLGPIVARIVRVVDGDTILVDAEPWPQQTVRVLVRLRGIDAPELHARCASARDAAEMAKDVLSDIVSHDADIELYRVSGDKYFGRVLADVRTPRGEDLSQKMLQLQLARTYNGGRRAKPRCTTAG